MIGASEHSETERSWLPCLRTAIPPSVGGDGQLEVWQNAVQSPRFVDMADGSPALLDTRVGCLFDDDALYVRFHSQEPTPVATVYERDDIVFRDNDVELFIDLGGCYYELEINAANTVYEVLFVWQDIFLRDRWFEQPMFDLASPDVYTFAGDFDRTPDAFWRGTHPRGVRYAFRNWDLPGLKTSVSIDGVLNSWTGDSVGWTCEIAVPWSGLSGLPGAPDLEALEGTEIGMFFGRFENLRIGPETVKAAWCLSPHGVLDTHQPGRFTRVRLASDRKALIPAEAEPE